MLNRLDLALESWRWPAVAMAASLAMIGAAHAFERFAFLYPCELCLRQREVYWAVAAMSVTALILWRIRQNARFILAVNIMLGLIFLTGTIVAAYHAGVEWKFWPAPSGCSAGPVDVMNITLDNLDRRQAVASCTEAPWSFIGLSMAGWNALISLGLACVSFRAAALNRNAQRELSPAE